MRNPPLSLYVHIPWCVQKCPYCDFNSHGVKSTIPEAEYISHLLDDLAIDAKRIEGREIETIFIGGGTPSLFSEGGMARLMDGIRARVALAEGAEITLEANPGTLETDRFSGFQRTGINRISIGVQSFQPGHLRTLGRIHDDAQAHQALVEAKRTGLPSFNLDLMHGLPDQSVENALSDLRQAIDHTPPHLSWYQLTIEPNTAFASRPPTLPDDDILWQIQEQGHRLLSQAGLKQYEISGYARPGHECRHNLNYWRFGDYLGIGCGAHGKITHAESGRIVRTVKVKHPRGYMELSRPYLDSETPVETDDLAFEYFMNRFRLVEACPKQEMQDFTGMTLSDTQQHALDDACDKGLLKDSAHYWQVTDKGRRYLNSLLSAFV
ncbi:radical SAM family heme chaperone HemW [Alteromonas halophila]|uniref:Heme chaperone HemW n=1 Tax=Alteromonas halophila TaxID=516698 RepID=A0A918JCU1_9ALTE|nr:radical SAM family heme chaperone HemW [Alteromonas halophila]GGW72675.1 YggW family oxidoreductase [Alteromonas halophila]